MENEIDKEIEQYDDSGVKFALYGGACMLSSAICAILGFIIGYFWN